MKLYRNVLSVSVGDPVSQKNHFDQNLGRDENLSWKPDPASWAQTKETFEEKSGKGVALVTYKASAKVGVGQSATALIFFGSAFICPPSLTYPRKVTDGTQNHTFL